MSLLKTKFLATLVFCDSPQLVALERGKTRYLALSVPSRNENKYIVVNVTKKDWQHYFDGSIDLNYVFTFPKRRRLYYCEINNINDPIVIHSTESEIPAEHFPERGFFSSDHTEPSHVENRSSEQETLFLDGQWELNEFGKFHQKYSDLYSFFASLLYLDQPDLFPNDEHLIKNAYLQKALKGGGSYLSLFTDLGKIIPRTDRLRLSTISKASPGKMVMFGLNELFEEIETLIIDYMAKRSKIEEEYSLLHSFLKDKELLRQSVSRFSETDPDKDEILSKTRTLSFALGLGDYFEIIRTLCQNNTLATAKVILALSRRLQGASSFFSQGRVAFENDLPQRS